MWNKTVKADGQLLLAAVIWGTGFVAQRKGMDFVGPMTFTGLRFVLGGLVLGAFTFRQLAFQGLEATLRRPGIVRAQGNIRAGRRIP